MGGSIPCRARNIGRFAMGGHGPLTGSYQGTFFFRDAGSEDERMVKTQKDWDSWDRSVADTEHMHYWESLTLAAAEAMRRFPAGAVRWTNIFGRG